MESTIVMRSVSALKCYENNQRHNENAVEKVAESIKEFGFLVPIVIDTNDVIIAGETRLKASKLLQLDKVPCIIADKLTDEQIKAFRLIENKTSEFATWDFEKLQEELKAIDIDIGLYNFPELDDVELNVSDDDFLKDTEIVREHHNKTTTCPKCGEVFEI